MVENGDEAVHRYQKQYQDIDVVLMDIEMPVMNGYDATVVIRDFEKEHGLSSMPIYGLSAHALAEHMEQAKKVGMDSFITKPITLS